MLWEGGEGGSSEGQEAGINVAPTIMQVGLSSLQHHVPLSIRARSSVDHHGHLTVI